jgi:folate-binding protein YgfZ
MNQSPLTNLHSDLGARWTEIGGCPVPADYGDAPQEYRALTENVAWLDLSSRSRLCVLGVDRHKFLNGQVTNNVKDLKPGQSCYAALVNAKAKIQSDLTVYCLDEELLLDFEPGLAVSVSERLQKYIIAEDVTVADAAPHYRLFSLRGPQASAALASLGLPGFTPPVGGRIQAVPGSPGEVYCASPASHAGGDYDFYVPESESETWARQLLTAARTLGGGPVGWTALETVRIEAGVPRFGIDMDESNLAPETGLENRAISYAKGCYIGQEIIARIRTYGQVARHLTGLRFAADARSVPPRGTALRRGTHEVGKITSAVASPRFGRIIALAYVRREFNQPGTELTLHSEGHDLPVTVVSLPFAENPESVG